MNTCGKSQAAAFSLDSSDGSRGVLAIGVEGGKGDRASVARRSPSIVLNVNVPNTPRQRILGIRQGRLAAAGAAQLSIVEAAAGYLQVTMAGTGAQPEAGTVSALLMPATPLSRASSRSARSTRPDCPGPPDNREAARGNAWNRLPPRMLGAR
jgi:hypothetical protein